MANHRTQAIEDLIMASSVPLAENSPQNTLSSDISTIHAFAQVSATVLDLNDLLSAALDILVHTYGFDLQAIILVNDQTDETELKAYQSSFDTEVLEPVFALAAEAIENQTVTKEEIALTKRFPATKLSCLIIPFPIGRLVIGSLVVAKATPYRFNHQEEQFLSIFASQLTVAVLNARTYARSQKQKQQELIRRQIATHLQELATIINATLDLNDVLDLILEHIAIVIPYDSAMVMLLEEQELVANAVSKLGKEHIGFKIDAAQHIFFQQALLLQYPSVFSDVTQNTFWKLQHPPFLENTKAWIGAPLVIRKHLIGILTMHHNEAGYFDNADLELVNTFANQASVAIENAQLYRREQEKVKQFKTVAKIGRRITETRDLQKLLEVVITGLHHDLGYEFITVFLHDSHSDTLLPKIASDIPPDKISALEAKLPLQGPGVISTAGRTEETILINDVNAFEGYYSGPGRESVRSELAIPLITHEHFIGVLDLQSSQLRSFSPEDVSLAQTVADQLAVAIETADLLEDRDQRIAELTTFNQIGSAITDPSHPGETLIAILERIKTLYQVEATSLMLLNGDTLTFEVAVGIPKQVMQPFSIKLGEGFAGWVAQHKQPLRIADASADPRHYKDVDQALGFDTRTLLAVPVQISDRVLGVIEVINPLDKRQFTGNDESILTFLASTIAVSIENTRLLATISQRASQIAGLLNISQSLTNLDLDKVLSETAKQVTHLLKSQFSLVYLVDETNAQAVLSAGYINGDFEIHPRSLSIDKGTVGWAIVNQTPLRINNIQKDSRFEPADHYPVEIYNILCVPLIVREGVIGVLETFNKQDNRPFTITDETLIMSLAGHAAMAIFNARLFNTMRQRERFALSLGRSGLLLNKNLDLENVLNVICRESLSLFEVDTVSVWWQENDTLLCLAAQGETEDQLVGRSLSVAKKPTSLLLAAFKVAKPIYKNNLVNPGHFIPNFVSPAKEFSALAVPLSKTGTAEGILLLTHFSDPNFFSQEMLSRAVIYSNQVTTAIENARLHQETERRLAEVSTLYTLAHRMAASLDIDQLLKDTVSVIRLALDSVGCNIFLLRDNRLIPSARSGVLSMAGHAFVLNSAQQIIETPQPINYQTASDFPSTNEPLPQDINALLIVPLRTRGQLLGALAIYDKRPYAFGPNEGRLLTIVATQIAASLENSQLFNDLQEYTKNLEDALTELQRLHSLQRDLVQNVSHDLRIPLTFIKGYVDLILEDSLGPIPEAVRKSLEIVSQRTTDLSRLVSDIVTHQKLEMNSVQIETTDLTQILDLAIASALPTAKKNDVSLNANIDPSIPHIAGDADRLSQVFDNLIGNALKFTSAGDKITVSAYAMDDSVIINVEDTGIGIDQPEIDKIFDRFYQTGKESDRHRGSGLGLSIVKQIIEAHHGLVTVTSKLGSGSNFSLKLPIKHPNLSSDNQ